MAHVIYRGPIGSEPQTVNLPVAGAYNPGIFVTSDGAELTVATGGDQDANLLVLSNLRLGGQDIGTAYVADATGVAYIPAPNEQYHVRMKAAAYAVGDPLMVDASGYLAVATAGKPIIAHFDGVAGAIAAGGFADVRIANSTAKA